MSGHLLRLHGVLPAIPTCAVTSGWTFALFLFASIRNPARKILVLVFVHSSLSIPPWACILEEYHWEYYKLKLCILRNGQSVSQSEHTMPFISASYLCTSSRILLSNLLTLSSRHIMPYHCELILFIFILF